VLKPYRGYGGRGIIRIKRNGEVSSSDLGNVSIQDDHAIAEIKRTCNAGCIAMDYLKRISLGDKRIIVLNGNILGAVLRVPSEGKWLANVAMGATTRSSQVTAEEEAMVDKINPDLQKKGIYLYGIDTIENDSGKRVLSEINVTNVGGLTQMEKLNGNSVIKPVITGLINAWENSNSNLMEN